MSSSSNSRLLSLDALRGFDMFWISGGSKLIHVLTAATGFGFLEAINSQLEHPQWNGFTAYDLIFPLFIFMAGVSTPFSFGSRLSKGTPRTKLLRKAIQRGIILVILGIIYGNGILMTSWDETRFASVLARIGLAGMAAQIIYLYFNRTQIYGWIVALLVGYWVFMVFFPVPGCGAGHLTIDCNPASYLDTLLLPGKLYLGNHDPEGLLSTLPAITAGLFGIIAGEIIRGKNPEVSDRKKVLILTATGIALIVAGLIWSTVFPLNKNLWTSSFALLTGGLSFILLALFYWIIDVLQFRRWTFFFVVIGMNSIVIYVAKKFIDFNYTAKALFGGIFAHASETWTPVLNTLAFVAVQWTFMYVLYRNKWFLKI